MKLAAPDAVMSVPVSNGNHARMVKDVSASALCCERCGTKFNALLTDGRCTTCNHRHGSTNRVTGAGGRLFELTSTPLGFSLLLVIVGSIQLALFLIALSGG
jgi:hypothetical protein